jgi:hypothetical protein
MVRMWTSDPVADMEAEQARLTAAQAAWEAENPETEYAVEYTVTLRVLAKGRDRDEAREAADKKLAAVLDGAGYDTIWEWDSDVNEIGRF